MDKGGHPVSVQGPVSALPDPAKIKRTRQTRNSALMELSQPQNTKTAQ